MTFGALAWRPALALGWLLLVASPAPASELLSAGQLQEQLGGHAVAGFYVADKKPFAEAYNQDGSIDYSDTDTSDTGHWSVKDGTFCTAYDHMDGGCWYVLKQGSNCYEFYDAKASDTGVPDANALAAREPTARAGRDGSKMNCQLPTT